LLKASVVAVMCCALGSLATAQLASGQDVVLQQQPAQSTPARPSHLTWTTGVGFTQPNGNASTLLDPGWNARAGVGWNFSPHFAVLGEYEFDRFEWESPPLGAGVRADGNVHLWSFNVEPVWRHKFTSHFGGYVEGGGGFYRLTNNYGKTVPGYDCNPLFGCYPISSDPSGRTSSNQGGANFGAGVTYKTARGGGLSYYTEVRFTWLDTHPETAAFFPVSFGVRW